MRSLLSEVSRRRRKAVSSPRPRPPLRLEPLEDRTLPSNAGIFWANEGTTTDTFTPAEHAVINEAIALWEQKLGLNAPLNVTFLGGSTSGLDLGSGVLAQTNNVVVNANGTSSATIEISRNAGGSGWFIDPTPQDNSEFTPDPSYPSSFTGGPNDYDMLTTVLHQLGYALGMVASSNPLLAHLTNVQNNTAIFRGSDNYVTYVSIQGSDVNLQNAFFPHDLMRPVQSPGERDLPSAADAHILSDVYGYTVNPGQPNPVNTGPDSPGMFDPTTATWYLSSGSGSGGLTIPPFQYGLPGWIPVVGDWTGSGHTGIGVFDPTTATFYLRNEDNAGLPDIVFQYGAPGWIPVTGDWNGDGITTVGVIDPKTMTWYLTDVNASGPPTVTPFQYGLPGWTPVTGDWDGSGTTTVGVYDPFGGNWYLRNENTSGPPDVSPFAYGATLWMPVTGDWTGQGRTTVGVVNPFTANWYLRNSNTSGPADIGPIQYGVGIWKAFAGNWDLSQPNAWNLNGLPATAVAPAANTSLSGAVGGNPQDPTLAAMQAASSQAGINTALSNPSLLGAPGSPLSPLTTTLTGPSTTQPV